MMLTLRGRSASLRLEQARADRNGGARLDAVTESVLTE